ncbi:MAG: BrnT family toxin [SAR324 cluster bacterium]|nr:BrnT family toxin [SAR324 cluster bacterium]
MSFETAAEVFLDPLQFNLPDEEHSEQEERWITMGISRSQRLLVVVHTFMEYHKTRISVRIISARSATPSERK